MVRVLLDGSLAGWRAHARALAAAGIPPAEVEWVDLLRHKAPGGDLFSEPQPSPLPAPPCRELGVPKGFLARAETVACHRSSEVWGLLYGLLHRLVHGERGLLDDPLDPDVAALTRLEKAGRPAAHKNHPVGRVRRPEDDGLATESASWRGTSLPPHRRP